MIPPPTGLRIRYCTSGVARRRPGTVASLVDLGSGGVIRCPHLGHLTAHDDDLPRRGNARVQGRAWSELAVTIATETGSPCLLGPGGKRLPTRSRPLSRAGRGVSPGGPRGTHRPAGRRPFSERSAATGRVAAARARVETVLTAAEHCRVPQASAREMFGVAPGVLHRAPREGICCDAPARAEASEGGVHRLLTPGLRARPGREEVRRPRALPPPDRVTRPGDRTDRESACASATLVFKRISGGREAPADLWSAVSGLPHVAAGLTAGHAGPTLRRHAHTTHIPSPHSPVHTQLLHMTMSNNPVSRHCHSTMSACRLTAIACHP